MIIRLTETEKEALLRASSRGYIVPSELPRIALQSGELPFYWECRRDPDTNSGTWRRYQLLEPEEGTRTYRRYRERVVEAGKPISISREERLALLKAGTSGELNTDGIRWARTTDKSEEFYFWVGFDSAKGGTMPALPEGATPPASRQMLIYCENSGKCTSCPLRKRVEGEAIPRCGTSELYASVAI